MARLPQAANTEGNKEKMEDFTPVAAGDYPAYVEKSGYKDVKDNAAHKYLQLYWKIFEGPETGKVLLDRLNLINSSVETVQIANKQSNSISDACGVIGALDSDDWHNKPVILSVRLDPATPKYAASNKITGYKPYTPTGAAEANQAAAETTRQPTPAEVAAMAAATATPPPAPVETPAEKFQREQAEALAAFQAQQAAAAPPAPLSPTPGPAAPPVTPPATTAAVTKRLPWEKEE